MHTRAIPLRTGACAALLALSLGAAGARGEDPRTNLDLYRDLADSIGRRVRTSLAVDTLSGVRVSVLPADVAWTIDAGFASAFGGLRTDGPATYHVQAGIRAATVDYGPPAPDGIFGVRRVERSVRLVLSVECTRGGGADPLLREDFEASVQDEIAAADIERVEHPSLAITKGRQAPEGFLSGIIEPVILIGALAVAVVLLFQVRS
jgi:hypothetical protein